MSTAVHNVLYMAGVLAFFATAAAAQDLVWEKDAEAAFKRAEAETRPVLILMHDAREKACVRMARRVYRDAKVKKALSPFILVPCLPMTTDHADRVFRFGDLTSEQLAENEQFIRERFFPVNTVKIPQHIVVTPAGKIILRKIYEMKTAAFREFLADALGAWTVTATRGLSARVRTAFEKIRTGTPADRKEAVQLLVDQNDEKIADLLFQTIQSLPKTSDRAACIRAMGYPRFADAGRILVRWLDDDDSLIVNSAVVSLEETSADDAVDALLGVYARTKSAEIKKDCLRAFGPCGAGRPDVRKILLAAVKDRREKFRVAAYLSLGHFWDAEVRALLMKRYKIEGRKLAPKAAIIWGLRQSGDPSVVDDIRRLLKTERNRELLDLGRRAVADLGGASSEQGVKGKRGKGALKAIYGADRIVRNEYADRRGGGRKGRKKR